MDETVLKCLAPSAMAPITLATEIMVMRENCVILVRIKKAKKKTKKKNSL